MRASVLLITAFAVLPALGDGQVPSDPELLKAFKAWWALPADGRASTPVPGKALPDLSKASAQAWRLRLWEAAVQAAKAQKRPKPSPEAIPGLPKDATFGAVSAGGQTLRYTLRAVGKKPKTGWPLYINFHGGGQDKAINDYAWSLAQTQYPVKEGLYLCPRAPRDVYECWLEPPVYELLDALLRELFLLQDVDPDRVYIMGYSLGGYGTLFLAPYMADRWAAAASSAGGGTRGENMPLANLRNTPLMSQIGTVDNEGVPRYETAKAYAEALKALRDQDPKGYVLEYREHPGKGHKIDDRDTPDWLAKFTRDPVPERLVWEVLTAPNSEVFALPGPGRFAWLGIDEPQHGQKVTAWREGNTIHLEAQGVPKLILFLDDRMVNLDQPVRVLSGDREVFHGTVPRRLETLAETQAERGDPARAFCARIEVEP